MKKLRPLWIEEDARGFHLCARVHFSGWKKAKVQGVLMKDCVLSELQRQFSSENPYFAAMTGNALDFPERMGQPIEVRLTLLEEKSRPYIRFVLLPFRGVSCAAFFPLWRPWGSKTVLLFSGDVRTRHQYTPKQVGLVACHEFGHAMGIGDLYGGAAPYGLCWRAPAAFTAEFPPNDLMRTSFRNDWFTPNDLEMALFAQKECAPQTHVPTGRWWKGLGHVSCAVRGKAVDPELTLRDRQRRKAMKKQRRKARLLRLLPFLKKREK